MDEYTEFPLFVTPGTRIYRNGEMVADLADGQTYHNVGVTVEIRYMRRVVATIVAGTFVIIIAKRGNN